MKTIKRKKKTGKSFLEKFSEILDSNYKNNFGEAIEAVRNVSQGICDALLKVSGKKSGLNYFLHLDGTYPEYGSRFTLKFFIHEEKVPCENFLVFYISNTGFPVTIQTPNSFDSDSGRIQCDNIESLESGVLEVLNRPQLSIHLKHLIDLICYN